MCWRPRRIPATSMGIWDQSVGSFLCATAGHLSYRTRLFRRRLANQWLARRRHNPRHNCAGSVLVDWRDWSWPEAVRPLWSNPQQNEPLERSWHKSIDVRPPGQIVDPTSSPTPASKVAPASIPQLHRRDLQSLVAEFRTWLPEPYTVRTATRPASGQSGRETPVRSHPRITASTGSVFVSAGCIV